GTASHPRPPASPAPPPSSTEPSSRPPPATWLPGPSTAGPKMRPSASTRACSPTSTGPRSTAPGSTTAPSLNHWLRPRSAATTGRGRGPSSRSNCAWRYAIGVPRSRQYPTSSCPRTRAREASSAGNRLRSNDDGPWGTSDRIDRSSTYTPALIRSVTHSSGPGFSRKACTPPSVWTGTTPNAPGPGTAPPRQGRRRAGAAVPLGQGGEVDVDQDVAVEDQEALLEPPLDQLDRARGAQRARLAGQYDLHAHLARQGDQLVERLGQVPGRQHDLLDAPAGQLSHGV